MFFMILLATSEVSPLKGKSNKYMSALVYKVLARMIFRFCPSDKERESDILVL